MADTTPEHPAGQWPDASLRPADDAPPAEWARYYRDHCGWIIFPTPGPADIISHATSLARRAVLDHVDLHRKEPDEETAQAIWDEAREIAEASRKAPIGYIFKAWSAKIAVAADVTDEMLRDAWEPLEASRGPRHAAHERGIAILPGRSSRGLPVCLVDVDPRHGGDLGGEWGARLPGPKVSTPGGGMHTLLLATGKETASADLGSGVDVIASGTPIQVPAGSATPARRWTSWDAPVLAPEALRKRGKRKAPPRPGSGSDEAAPRRAHVDGEDHGDAEEEPGRAAALIAAEVGDGERNWSAACIVGVLARPWACPDDFVRACLELLAEDLACRDLAPRDDVQADLDRWRHALTRGPRDADFAAEILACWSRVRDTSRRPWSEAKARTVARSLWKTCDRREEGNAGAEDFGYGPPLGLVRAGIAAPLPVPEDMPTETAEAPADDAAAVPYPPPTPEQAAAAAAASASAKPKWRGGVDPRTYVRSLGAFYTDDELERDLLRDPIRIGDVMPAVDFVTGMPSTSPDLLTAPSRMGWGDHLGRALGGMSPGDFRVIGAGGAGAGKTWFECWLAHGLALATACRILDVPDFRDRPVVLPVWVTEMPKRGELYYRAASAYLGFDQACLAAGRQAHDAPGVRAMAERLGWSPHEVVAHARMLERLHGANEKLPLCIARHRVIKVLSLSDLPRRGRLNGVVVDHRAGPDLVDHLADAVDVFREDLATDAGVTTDKVLPLVIIDPGQRFAGDGESEKRAIDALFNAIDTVLCRDLGCAVIGTSDTTKAAAREVNIETFLSKDAGALAADIFAGSQAIIHHADCIALCAERPRDGGLRARQWARVLKGRNSGASSEAYPFAWDMHLGRFTPEAPEPLRDAPAAPGGDRRGRTDHAPAPPIGSSPSGIRAPWQGH